MKNTLKRINHCQAFAFNKHTLKIGYRPTQKLFNAVYVYARQFSCNHTLSE